MKIDGKNIVIISTVKDNLGIQQYSIEVAKSLQLLDVTVSLYIPDVKSIIIPEDVKTITKRYKISNNIMDKSYNDIILDIISIKPDIIYLTSDSLYSYAFIFHMKRMDIKIAMAVHNVVEHPRKFRNIHRFGYSIYKKIIKKILANSVMESVSHIVLLSKASYEKYKEIYIKHANKAVLMRLAPHVISDEIIKPPEIKETFDYYLFFGNIDKYKNVESLIRAYVKFKEVSKPKLLIAGHGEIEGPEKEIAINDPNIILINRFLDNEEMNWLFTNCICVVLPYIEASQSGVMMLSYHFLKPVIVSNLKEFKYDLVYGKNGLTYNSEEELISSLSLVAEQQFQEESRDFIEEFIAHNYNQKSILTNGFNEMIKG